MLEIRKDIKRVVYVEPLSKKSVDIMFNEIRKDLGLPFVEEDIEYRYETPPAYWKHND